MIKILKYHSPRWGGLCRGAPGRRLGLLLDGVLGHGLVLEGNHVLLRLRLLLTSRLRLELVHELEDNFTNVSTHIGKNC